MKLCGFDVGLNQPLFLIAGPCVIESEQMALDTAGQLKEICRKIGIPFIYKSSYDKANRSSGKTFRGFGMEANLSSYLFQNLQTGFHAKTAKRLARAAVGFVVGRFVEDRKSVV